jgi:hypothetical protein
LTSCSASRDFLFGACLPARIDGTSPVDYLPEEPKREAVRRTLRERPTTWEEVLAITDANVMT